MRKKVILALFVLILNIFSVGSYAKDLSKPELMLANIYHKGIDLSEYWISEKYDGVRVIWNGTQLVSRGGNIYHAPEWFTKGFPKQKLDGELWVKRQSFSKPLRRMINITTT